MELTKEQELKRKKALRQKFYTLPLEIRICLTRAGLDKPHKPIFGDEPLDPERLQSRRDKIYISLKENLNKLSNKYADPLRIYEDANSYLIEALGI